MWLPAQPAPAGLVASQSDSAARECAVTTHAPTSQASSPILAGGAYHR